MDFLFYLNSVLLGIGLAMDAFSVSAANGLNEPNMTGRKMILISGVFGIFQTLMPLAGWFCIRSVAEQFDVFSKFIPIISLILLLYIGIKMIIEGIRGNDEDCINHGKLTVWAIFVQGIATSIDALSVGFAIENLPFFPALVETLIIGAVTFAVCILGCVLGRKLGTKLAGKASVLGGIILVAIGIEIFVRGFGDVLDAFNIIIVLLR